MGFIQNFKDNYFIGDCINTMKRIAPETRDTASFFCADHREQLLARKAKGADAYAALCVVCAVVLDHAQERIDNGLSYGEFQAMIDASRFGKVIAASNSVISGNFARLGEKLAMALNSENGLKLMGNRR